MWSAFLRGVVKVVEGDVVKVVAGEWSTFFRGVVNFQKGSGEQSVGQRFEMMTVLNVC